jgi:hypothetical protein
MVLTSILIGLGIAELLHGLVRMLRSDFREGFYLPQVLWAIYLFLYFIVVWWSRWDLRENFHWNFLQLLMSLAGPVLAFILSGLVFARKSKAREYYFRQQKVFFTLLPLIMIISLIHEIVIEGTSIISITSLIASAIMLLTVVPRYAQKDWIHIFCAACSIGILNAWIFFSIYMISN